MGEDEYCVQINSNFAANGGIVRVAILYAIRKWIENTID